MKKGRMGNGEKRGRGRRKGRLIRWRRSIQCSSQSGHYRSRATVSSRFCPRGSPHDEDLLETAQRWLRARDKSPCVPAGRDSENMHTCHNRSLAACSLSSTSSTTRTPAPLSNDGAGPHPPARCDLSYRGGHPHPLPSVCIDARESRSSYQGHR